MNRARGPTEARMEPGYYKNRAMKGDQTPCHPPDQRFGMTETSVTLQTNIVTETTLSPSRQAIWVSLLPFVYKNKLFQTDKENEQQEREINVLFLLK